MKFLLTLVAVIVILIVSIKDSVAQKETTEKFKLTGDIRTGSGFAPLFGLKTSDEWSTYYSVDVQHESGFGIGAYRFTDFKTVGLGKIGFFDLYWSGNVAKNLSLYSAVEYGFFDNDKQMSFWCPYGILSWTTHLMNFDLSPMYCYYDKQKSNQFVLRFRAVKEVYKGGVMRFSGWYNSLVENKFYEAVGFTQQLPRKFYLQVDVLFREGKTQPMLSLGYKF